MSNNENTKKDLTPIQAAAEKKVQEMFSAMSDEEFVSYFDEAGIKLEKVPEGEGGYIISEVRHSSEIEIHFSILGKYNTEYRPIETSEGVSSFPVAC